MSANYLKLLGDLSKLPVPTDNGTLDIYCEYLLNDSSKYINFANLTNLSDYINRMDPKLFMTNDAKMARYEFVRLYLEARIERGIINRKMALRYVKENVDGRYDKIIQREILNSIEPDKLKKKDIEFINSMVFAQLNQMFLHAYKGPIVRLVEDLESGQFGKNVDDCVAVIQLFQKLNDDLMKAQRRAKQDNRFNLTDATHFKAVMSEAIERILSEGTFWRTGMQGLNLMLGGGVENARTYNIIGATGGFKSGTLLNIWKQIKMYNKGHPHKDPNKRSTVLFLSQENNIWETIQRIFGIFGTTKSMKKFSPDEIMKILSDGGFRVVEDELDIDLEFRYYGNMDIGVPDIRGIYEELDNEGREVICVIQDYIERLRPPLLSVDRRVQLNDVSNQLHDLAIELDIPIITASQFNREGVATIEDMQASEKHDIAMKVGSKNVSESFGMLKNFDVNITIVTEYDSGEERFWLAFRRQKFRGDDQETLDYFCQPFVGRNSRIQLMCDVDLDTPVYRRSMVADAAALAADDANNITELTRRENINLMPVTEDIDAIDTEEFMDNFFDEVEKSSFDRAEAKYRDSEGFYILIPKGPLGMKMHMVN